MRTKYAYVIRDNSGNLWTAAIKLSAKCPENIRIYRSTTPLALTFAERAGPINKIMRRHTRLSSTCLSRGRGAFERCACSICVRSISAIESDDIAEFIEKIVEYECGTATTIAFRMYLFIGKWKSMKINLSLAVGVSAVTLLHAHLPAPISHVDWEIQKNIFRVSIIGHVQNNNIAQCR